MIDQPLPLRRKLGWWSIVGSAVGALLVVGLYVGSAYHLDYVAYVPGGATDLRDRITITGSTDYPPKGRIFLAAVGVTPRLTPLALLQVWLDPNSDAKSFASVYPVGPKDEMKVNLQMMDDSKQVAALVALRYLGRDGKGEGAKIVQVLKGSPADTKLAVGDTILKIGDHDICVTGDLRSAIQEGDAKTPVNLTVRTAAGATTSVVILPKYEPAAKLRFVGIVANTVRCTLPIDVRVDTGRIGGPSAGLAMTLSILDRLTPGELTGGVPVAATGTIESDGSVGDVGGVVQKTAGVKAAGAKLFLVPPGEERDARARAGKLPVVVVHNLAEALAALRRYGGQSLPSPGATP